MFGTNWELESLPKFEFQLVSLGDSFIGSALVRSDNKSKESLVEIEISPGTDVIGLVDNAEESKTL